VYRLPIRPRDARPRSPTIRRRFLTGTRASLVFSGP